MGKILNGGLSNHNIEKRNDKKHEKKYVIKRDLSYNKYSC